KEKTQCMYYCALIDYCLRDGEIREGRPYACAEFACPHFYCIKGNEQRYENLIEQELKDKCIERLKFIEEEIVNQEAETLHLSQIHCDAIEGDASKYEKDKCAKNVRASIKKTDQLKKEYASTQKSLEKINKHLSEFRKKNA
ncbi:MAG: hypothetical protein IKU09_08715, partial [Firmicutes bacterium]|nr:hypothetical protein [Bacillota bacterium]